MEDDDPNHGQKGGKSDETSRLLNQISTIRKWKWSFCFTMVMVIMFIIGFFILLTYNLLFTSPYFYVDQIQINQLPIVDRTIGFTVILRGSNPTVMSVPVDSILLNVKIYDSQRNIFYSIDTPIEYTFQNMSRIEALGDNRAIQFSTKIYIGSSPDFIQLFDLLMRNIYAGIQVKGKVGMYVGGFYHSQTVQKSQHLMHVDGSAESYSPVVKRRVMSHMSVSPKPFTR